MSKIALKANDSGTGTFEIQVPATNTNRVLELPDEAGKVLTTGNSDPAEVFKQSNILGTVSQSAGVPTGAIIQRGSNANGDFVKYADGTLICTRHDLTMSATNSTVLNITWFFPSTFVNNQYFASLTPPSAGAEWTTVGARNNVSYQFLSNETTSSVQLGLFLISNETVTVSNCHACAIGRWY